MRSRALNACRMVKAPPWSGPGVSVVQLRGSYRLGQLPEIEEALSVSGRGPECPPLDIRVRKATPEWVEGALADGSIKPEWATKIRDFWKNDPVPSYAASKKFLEGWGNLAWSSREKSESAQYMMKAAAGAVAGLGVGLFVVSAFTVPFVAAIGAATAGQALSYLQLVTNFSIQWRSHNVEMRCRWDKRSTAYNRLREILSGAQADAPVSDAARLEVARMSTTLARLATTTLGFMEDTRATIKALAAQDREIDANLALTREKLDEGIKFAGKAGAAIVRGAGGIIAQVVTDVVMPIARAIPWWAWALGVAVIAAPIITTAVQARIARRALPPAGKS